MNFLSPKFLKCEWFTVEIIITDLPFINYPTSSEVPQNLNFNHCKILISLHRNFYPLTHTQNFSYTLSSRNTHISIFCTLYLSFLTWILHILLLLLITQVLNYIIQALSYDEWDRLAYGSTFYIIVHNLDCIHSWISVNIFIWGYIIYIFIIICIYKAKSQVRDSLYLKTSFCQECT